MKRTLILLILFLFLGNPFCWGEMLSVAKSKINVRTGPSTNHEILWQVHKDYPVKVLEKEGAWVKTKDYEGDVGWVYRSLLSKVHTVIVNKDKVNIRTGPGIKYRLAFRAEKDVIFRVIDRKDNWLKVKYGDEYVGWIRNDLVWGD